MKATAEKSTTTTASTSQKSDSPFFAKAGGGDFFAPVKQGKSGFIQTKLAVNKPGDKFEREADSVANRVMRMQGTQSGITNKKTESPVEEKLQRKEENSGPEKETGNQAVDESTQAAIRSKTSGGAPLPRSVRNFMEPRFGNDFSSVRVHNDQTSSQINQQLNARAFTHKNHIFFGSGQYNPDTPQGKQLLAHELTHVVQQGASPGLSNTSQILPDQASNSKVEQRTGENGTATLQRGILGANAEGAGPISNTFSRVVNEINSVNGTGIANATSWISNIGSAIRMSAASAWTWIRNLAGRIGMGVQNSWNWVREIASNLGSGLTSAWSWIQNLTSRIGMGLSAAWSWIRSVASELGTGISSAWAWIENVAARIGLARTLAWQWLRRMASMLGTTLTNAWTWIQGVAARMSMMIANAWQMIQFIAGVLAMAITAAWNWIQAVASRIMMAVLGAWFWIQSMAAMLGMVILMAWLWIQMAAAKVKMTIVRAWNWIFAVSQRIGMRILSAFLWLMNMAARAGKIIVAAFKWLAGIATAVGRAIVAAWKWILGLVKRFALAIYEFWDWWINAPSISIETAFAAPDGSGKSRRKAGVGERVTFTGSKTGEWTASGGTPVTQATGTSFVWTAPNRAASVKISLKSGKYTRDVMMNVLEPSSITAKKKEEMTFRRGRQGVGMKLTFQYHPKTVSFGNADAKEVSGPATNIRGYFLDHGGDYHHDSGDTFFPINHDNQDSATDTAALFNYPAPWSEGGYDWIIPNHFKVRTEAGDGKKFTDVTQAFTIEGTDGTSTVSKGGEDAERTP